MLVQSEPGLFELKATLGGASGGGPISVRLVGNGAEAGAALAEGGGEEGGQGAELEHRPLAPLASSLGELASLGELGGGESTDSSVWKRSDAQEQMMRSVCDAGGLDSPEQRRAWLPTFSRMPDADGVPVIYMP